MASDVTSSLARFQTKSRAVNSVWSCESHRECILRGAYQQPVFDLYFITA
jgi:hypothetical protein